MKDKTVFVDRNGTITVSVPCIAWVNWKKLGLIDSNANEELIVETLSEVYI